MAEQNEAPRPDLQGASKKEGRKGYQSKSPDLFPSQDSCFGPGCGTCYITAIGDKRWCEIETINKLKRELARALEGEGSRDE